jgi:hypothetical protein
MEVQASRILPNGSTSGPTFLAASLNRALAHLHAMDFAGVLTICNSTFPLVREPDLRRTPDRGTARPITQIWLILKGTAETALGHYESALEHLLAARGDMDRPPVVFAWFLRMRLESALTELWLAKCDQAQARRRQKGFFR